MQCAWRLYACTSTDGFRSEATWKIHLSPPRDSPDSQQTISVPNQISGVVNSMKPHLALKRRKSSKLSLKEALLPTTLLELCEQPSTNQNANSNTSPTERISPLIAGGVACNLAGSVAVAAAGAGGDMVCYMEEPTAGNVETGIECLLVHRHTHS